MYIALLLKRKEPRRLVRQGSFYIYHILHIYIRALLPYDCRSCNGCHHQYVFTNIVFIVFFYFNRGKYKHIVLIAKTNLTFFSYKNIFLKILFFIADNSYYLLLKRKEQTMKRKHLIAVGAIIAIVLLLYWLFIAEDLNAWLNVN